MQRYKSKFQESYGIYVEFYKIFGKNNVALEKQSKLESIIRINNISSEDITSALIKIRKKFHKKYESIEVVEDRDSILIYVTNSLQSILHGHKIQAEIIVQNNRIGFIKGLVDAQKNDFSIYNNMSDISFSSRNLSFIESDDRNSDIILNISNSFRLNIKFLD